MSKRVVGLRNGGSTGVNPKDKVGAKKIDPTVISPIGIAETAFAMMDGDDKYGAFNYRVEPILARTYVAAAIRHLLDWLDGEERAQDSLAHHLAHASACCMILMDAQAQGTLTDDRLIQVAGGTNTAETFKLLESLLHQRNQMRAMVQATGTEHHVKPGDTLIVDREQFLKG